MPAFDPTAPHRNGDGASHPRSTMDRLPPSNLEAERCLIGALLLHNPALHDVAMLVRPEDFYRDAHGKLYEAILALYDAGKPVDVAILANAMGPEAYAAVGGDELLAEILVATPSAANATYHAGIVREKAVKRKLIEAATETLRATYADDRTAAETVAAAEERFFAISEAEATGETLAAAEVMTLTMDRVELRESGETTGLASGFPDLDDLTDGLQPGNLVLIAARPAVGKSAIAMNIADHVSTAGGTATLFVSLEMNRAEVGERLLSARARVDGYRLKNPNQLSLTDKRALGEARHVLSQARLFIDDTPMRTVTQIAANARRLKSRHGLGLLIVDYIQLIDGQRLKGEQRQEEVARTSKRLKGLARELQIPVIALAQLNRQSEARDDRRPRLADLRESGQLEADADIVLLLHRPSVYDPNDRPGEADLIVAKNRNGATGTVRLAFMNNCTRFATLETHAVQEPIRDEAY